MRHLRTVLALVVGVAVGMGLARFAHADDGVANVLDVRFEDGGDRTRLVIESDVPVAWHVDDRAPSSPVLLLAGVVLPERLEWTAIDTTTVGGPVVSVRPDEGDRGDGLARVVVQLRRETPARIEQRGRLLVWEFAKPGRSWASVNALDAPRFAGLPVELHLRDAYVHNVLRRLGEEAGVEVLVSDYVRGKLSVSLEEMRWDEALDAVVQALGLVATRTGEIVWVASARGVPLDPTPVSELPVTVVHRRWATGPELARRVASRQSPHGTVDVHRGGHAVIVRDIAGDSEATAAIAQSLPVGPVLAEAR